MSANFGKKEVPLLFLYFITCNVFAFITCIALRQIHPGSSKFGRTYSLNIFLEEAKSVY